MVINSFSVKIIDSSSLKKTRFCERRMLEKLTIKILNNFFSKSTHHPTNRKPHECGAY